MSGFILLYVVFKRVCVCVCVCVCVLMFGTIIIGNLALSRAIGDFNFKSNPDLPQAEQIVTGRHTHLRIHT